MKFLRVGAFLISERVLLAWREKFTWRTECWQKGPCCCRYGVGIQESDALRIVTNFGRYSSNLRPAFADSDSGLRLMQVDDDGDIFARYDNDGCAFLNSEGACVLQIAEKESPFPPIMLKPDACYFYPLVFRFVREYDYLTGLDPDMLIIDFDVDSGVSASGMCCLKRDDEGQPFPEVVEATMWRVLGTETWKAIVDAINTKTWSCVDYIAQTVRTGVAFTDKADVLQVNLQADDNDLDRPAFTFPEGDRQNAFLLTKDAPAPMDDWDVPEDEKSEEPIRLKRLSIVEAIQVARTRVRSRDIIPYISADAPTDDDYEGDEDE